MKKTTLGIYGAGGLGREVLELAKIINSKDKRWDNFIFIVDNSIEKTVNGVDVYSYDNAKEIFASALEITVGIGEPAVREEKFKMLADDGVYIPSLIHPDVHIPETTTVGKGVVIQTGCFVSCNITIGDYVYVQPQCVLGHDVVLEEGCMISCTANLAGKVSVGKYTYVGMGAIIKEKTTVGENAIVGMGTVVYKDVSDGAIAMGNPARIVQKNEDRRVFKR